MAGHPGTPGGDEFAILLESCSLDEAMRTAEALREAVRNFKFTWEERTFRLGASIGVVPISVDNADVASVLSAAGQRVPGRERSGTQPRAQLRRNDIDLMRRRREMQWPRAHQQCLGRRPLRAVPADDPAAADPGSRLHYELLLRMRDETARSSRRINS